MTAEEMLWEYGGDILPFAYHGSGAHDPPARQHHLLRSFRGGDALQHPSGSKNGAGMWIGGVSCGAHCFMTIFLYNWREHNRDHKLHGFYHARKAMENAQRDFGLNPLEANIIHRHTFPLNPTPPKYKESVVAHLRGQDLCHPGGLELRAERIDPALPRPDGNEVDTASKKPQNTPACETEPCLASGAFVIPEKEITGGDDFQDPPFWTAAGTVPAVSGAAAAALFPPAADRGDGGKGHQRQQQPIQSGHHRIPTSV